MATIQIQACESELLLKINQGLAPELHTRYVELIGNRREEQLTTEEYQELLALTAQVEGFEAQRVAALAELAQLRHISLQALLDDLHISAKDFDRLKSFDKNGGLDKMRWGVNCYDGDCRTT